MPAAEQSLTQAQANLVLATQQYERAQDLKAKGFVTQSALDDAKRNLDVAKSQLDAARLQVASNRPTGSDFLVAQTALAQARATLAAAQAKLDQTVIRAPLAGTLIARKVEPGDVVQPGKELMVLAPVGETQIVVQIDEKNLSQLKLGQKAMGSADAYPRERFAAELFYINPGIDALRGSVEVKLRVPEPPAYLRQDMTVSVDIEVGRRTDAVVVPSAAVFDAAGAQPWVLAIEGRRAVRRPVTLGLKGDGRDEVTAGVAPGDRLVADSSAGIRAGQRVRADHRDDSPCPMNPLGRFEVIVAFRFMREGLTQTLLIVFGVALGAGVIIFMSALLAGLQSNIVRRTLNFQAPIQIRAPEQVARPLRRRPGVESRGADPAALAAASLGRPVAEGARRRGAHARRRRPRRRSSPGPASRCAARRPSRSRSPASRPRPTSTWSRFPRRSSPAGTTWVRSTS